MLIYKIFRDAEWRDLRDRGETAGAPVDVADGFIHFSTAAQVRETAAKWFGDAPGLWLVGCESEALGPALRWEPSRGGDLFPHLYRRLVTADVVSVAPLTLEGAAHRFPAAIP